MHHFDFNKKIFLDIIKEFLKNREDAKKNFGKGSLEEQMWKLISNSLYGKMGQGLRNKKAFSLQALKSTEIPNSVITHAAYASLTTSFTRAVISATMNELHLRGYRTVSVTTDGLVTDADENTMQNLTLYDFSNIIKDTLNDLNLDSNKIFELKHKSQEFISAKTRVSTGVGQIQNYDIMKAVTGYRIDKSIQNKHEHVARLYLERKGKVETTLKVFPSVRDLMLKDRDFLAEEVKRKLNWEYDFKRKIDRVEEVESDVLGLKHIHMTTIPWESVEEFSKYRDIIDKSNMCLKTVDDYYKEFERIEKKIKWQDAYVKSNSEGGINRTMAIHTLRAFRQRYDENNEEYYICYKNYSMKEVIEIFSSIFNTTISVGDYKMAKNRKVDKNILADAIEKYRKEFARYDIFFLYF